MEKINLKKRATAFKELGTRGKRSWLKEFTGNIFLYMLLFMIIIFIAIASPSFLSLHSIINIISQSAIHMPIALGMAGIMIITGIDLSAGHVVGLVSIISISLLQKNDWEYKYIPEINTFPIIAVLVIVLVIGGIIGLLSGLCVSRLNIRSYFATTAVSLITYSTAICFLAFAHGGRSGIAPHSIFSLNDSCERFISGGFLSIGGVKIPNYVWYAILIVFLIWFMWDKTKFGKNMFAIGTDRRGAIASGINVKRTIILTFVLAGTLYSTTGFFASTISNYFSVRTGNYYEVDAIAACVIGGVSLTGGRAKIRGVVMGVILYTAVICGLEGLCDAYFTEGFIDGSVYFKSAIRGFILLVACIVNVRKSITNGNMMIWRSNI